MILFPLILVMLVTYLFIRSNHPKDLNNQQVAEQDPELPKQIIFEAMDLVASKDFRALSQFIDDKEGVDFQPYYSWDAHGRHLSKDEVNSFFFDVAERKWGVNINSGADLVMTNEEYYTSYIYSHDFSKLGTLSIDSSLVNDGATVSLSYVLTQMYGENTVKYAEFYIPLFEGQYEGLDWQALALVFKNINNTWKLVGILHNQWTI